MGNIGDAITSGSIPAVGTTGTTYASQINLFLTEVKARLEASMPKASLAAGALDMNGSAVSNVSRTSFSDVGGVPSTPTASLQMYNNDLYWVSGSGTVQITSGGSLNAGSIGGITGDYGGTNPAQFRFVDADQEYYAYDAFAGGAWAYIWAKGVDFAKNSTSTTRIRTIAPSTLASNYTLTLPSVPSGVDKFLYIGNTGVMGQANHSYYTNTYSWLGSNNTATVVRAGAIGSYLTCTITGGATPIAGKPLDFPIGVVITAFAVDVIKASNSSTTLAIFILKTDSAGTESTVGTATYNGNATGAHTMSVTGLNETITAGYAYTLVAESSNASASAADSFVSSRVVYTIPLNIYD